MQSAEIFSPFPPESVKSATSAVFQKTDLNTLALLPFHFLGILQKEKIDYPEVFLVSTCPCTLLFKSVSWKNVKKCNPTKELIVHPKYFPC